MSGDTAIQWTDKTWNPVVGCTKVSQGCKHCYAQDLHDARHQQFKEGKHQNVPQYAHPFTTIQLKPERLDDPLSWRKPCKVFVNSVSDLFHEDVPELFIRDVFSVMALAQRHTFQILTKRPARMRQILNGWRLSTLEKNVQLLYGDAGWINMAQQWPLPNVWLGTSVENQQAAEERIPHLLETPAAVRFLSCEPLIGPVDLQPWMWFDHCPEECHPEQFGTTADEACVGCEGLGRHRESECNATMRMGGLHWVIAGGESGKRARPMNIEWARELRDRCEASEVPFFFKQWGMYDQHGLKAPSGRGWTHRTLDGREHNDFPEVKS